MTVDEGQDLARARRERDFYAKLLDLGTQDELVPFLEEALAMIVDIAGARRGYLEIRDYGGEDEPPRFWIARGCTDDDVEEIRTAFSRGIIAEAVATGETVVTISASNDARFMSRGSVRRNRIEAVICAPVGADPPFGVVYLQERGDAGPFSEDDRRHVEVFARHLATLADRLLIRKRRRDETDPTQAFRRMLRLDGFVGRSAALAKVLRQVALVAPLDVGVLLTGHTGTGKTQIAKLIHSNGPRAIGPFVEVNCAAVPGSLFENELFGSVPGAHSAALRQKVDGKVAAAQGGTLFLDEVGELELAAQAKLLQLLQSKEYYPLGASRSQRADVRVIAATNADLAAAVAQRTFREDLLYRLQVLPIRVPSLVERREDIADLCAYFCRCACDTHQLPQLSLSPAAIRAAEAAEWPGNVRQLAHAVEGAAIRAAGEGAAQIEREHLLPESADARLPSSTSLTFQEATRRFQAQLLTRVLDDTGWSVTEAAGRLDLTRSHVYNLIKSFGLRRGA